MALPLLNNAEAQTSGTAVATDGSNTGGTNANAFNAAVIGANMSLTFDNTHPAHGTNGYKMTQTGTTPAITYEEWTATAIGTAVPHIFGAIYVYLTVTPGSTLRFIRFANGATLIGYIAITSGTPTVAFRSAADAQIGTASTALTLNVVMRIEFDVLFGASGTATGAIVCYTGDGTTPLATNGALGVNAFGTSAGTDIIRYGANTANWMTVAGPTSMWWDSINLNSTGVPGPGPYVAAGTAGVPQRLFVSREAQRRSSRW